MSDGHDDDGSRRPPRPPRQGLTAEAFEALLRRLDPDDREHAGELYEEIRRKLVRLFEWRGCDFPEDLVDETFNRVARRLAEHVELQDGDPYSYFCGVAHRIVKEVWRQHDRLRRQWEAEGPVKAAEPVVPALTEPNEKLVALQDCLERLPPGARRLILQYYEGDDRIRSRRQLADEQKIALNALRIRVHRVRRAVEDCLQESRRR